MKRGDIDDIDRRSNRPSQCRDRLILSPVPTKTLLAALRQSGALPEEDRMPPIDNFPAEAINP